LNEDDLQSNNLSYFHFENQHPLHKLLCMRQLIMIDICTITDDRDTIIRCNNSGPRPVADFTILSNRN